MTVTYDERTALVVVDVQNDFADAGGSLSVPGAGDVVTGPAVLEEFSSTVPLHPGFEARVDDYGNLVIRRHPVVEERTK